MNAISEDKLKLARRAVELARELGVAHLQVGDVVIVLGDLPREGGDDAEDGRVVVFREGASPHEGRDGEQPPRYDGAPENPYEDRDLYADGIVPRLETIDDDEGDNGG